MTRAIAKGAIWMVLFKLTERSLGLISTLILARLLVPADFGLVAMAMSVIALVELASAFSFEIVLIQRERPTREHYDTAWTMNVVLGIGCALLAAGLAYPAALFYNEPRLTLIVVVVAATLVIQSLENIGVVEFRRSMNFSREFSFLTSKKLVAFVVTLALAFLTRSYWALVAGVVTGRVAGVVFSYRMQPYRPRVCFRCYRDLLSFSGWLFANNIVGFATARLSHFIVGRLHGPAALGFFTVGSEIAQLPATELTAPINRAVFPGFARMATNLGVLRQGLLDVTGVLAVWVLPASVGVAALADPLVRTVLGNKWVDAIVLVQILAFNGAIYAMTSNNFSVYLALGRAHIQPLLLGSRLIFYVPLVAVLSSTHGIVGVAYAELGASALMLMVSYPVLFRVLALRSGPYVATLWRPLLAATAMAVAVSVVVRELANGAVGSNPLVQLLVGVPCGIVVYGVGLLILWVAAGKPRGAETYILEYVTALLLRLKRA
jgi:O-antigen/teichoic acid export membrane protein